MHASVAERMLTTMHDFMEEERLRNPLGCRLAGIASEKVRVKVLGAPASEKTYPADLVRRHHANLASGAD